MAKLYKGDANGKAQLVPLIGLKGEAGPQGPQGETGPQGPAGQGVPAGGTAGQMIIKIDNANYNAAWTTVFNADESIHMYKIVTTRISAQYQKVDVFTDGSFGILPKNVQLPFTTYDGGHSVFPCVDSSGKFAEMCYAVVDSDGILNTYTIDDSPLNGYIEQGTLLVSFIAKNW